MPLPLNTIPEREVVYEEITEIKVPQIGLPNTGNTTVSKKSSPTAGAGYEDVEEAGLQPAAENGVDSYHFTLCSAYGVSLDHAVQH